MEKGLTEPMLLDLTREIGGDTKLIDLGVALGYKTVQMTEYEELNSKSNSSKKTPQTLNKGTAKMLTDWRKNTEKSKQLAKLKTALTKAKLKGVAVSFFKAFEKMDKAKKAQLSEKGKAGTSTATANNKPMTKRTPPKKSAVKVPQDGSKPGASKKPAIAKDAPNHGKGGTSCTINTTTKSKTVITNK